MPSATLCCVTIDHGGPGYLYEQLAGIIRGHIRDGTLPSRAAVPSITALAADHELSTVTVRRALKVLKDEGLIETYPGRGTFVV